MQKCNHLHLVCLLFILEGCKRRWATKPVALFYITRDTKQYFFIFCNLDVEKSQILSLPMDQNANLAESHLCPVPTRKSGQDSCCRGRQIHKSGSPLSSTLPLQCSALFLRIAFIICWVLGNISLYFSAYLPNQPSGPLGFLWPSGEIFYEAWHPLEHQKLFPRMDWGPVPLLTHTALHRLRKKPISCRELFFSHIGEMCQKIASR